MNIAKNGNCRFGYPKDINDTAKFELKKGNWTFLPERNSQTTVPYNTKILNCWRSNIDITVVSSTEILSNYITKYVTKTNQKSLMSTM